MISESSRSLTIEGLTQGSGAPGFQMHPVHQHDA